MENYLLFVVQRGESNFHSGLTFDVLISHPRTMSSDIIIGAIDWQREEFLIFHRGHFGCCIKMREIETRQTR